MNIPQGVLADVPSGYFSYRIFDYKHHSCMDTHQYEHVHVP
jgi:hypothetical protein